MNSVPPSATSTRPGLACTAPVKAPFSWPNNSLSSRLSCRAAQLMVTSGLSRRGLPAWMARATTSLPVPLGPRTSTVASVGATFSIRAAILRIAGLEPTRRWRGSWRCRCCTSRCSRRANCTFS